jgi:glycosyltransferase involved in cell wall biosynthesis
MDAMHETKNILFVMNWPDNTGLMLKRAHQTYEHLAQSLKQFDISCFIAYPEVFQSYSGCALNVVQLDCNDFFGNRAEIKSFLKQNCIGTIVYIDPPLVWAANPFFKAWGVTPIAYVRYSHGFVHMRDNTPKTILKRAVHELGLFSASKYIAITRIGQSKLTSSVGIPQRKVTYIRNGIDSSIFPIEIRKESLSTVKNIVSVFQLRPQKNIFFLLRVIQSLSKRRNDICYTHVGGGEQLEDAIACAKALGIEDLCEFVGTSDNPIKYLSKADVFIHASLNENCSNAITEAMGCGTPVVAVKSDSALEQITPEIGVVVDELDEAKYTQAIEKYLDDPLARQKAHHRGPERARNNFSIDSQSQGLERLLLQTLS